MCYKSTSTAFHNDTIFSGQPRTRLPLAGIRYLAILVIELVFIGVAEQALANGDCEICLWKCFLL